MVNLKNILADIVILDLILRQVDEPMKKVSIMCCDRK